MGCYERRGKPFLDLRSNPDPSDKSVYLDIGAVVTLVAVCVLAWTRDVNDHEVTVSCWT